MQRVITGVLTTILALVLSVSAVSAQGSSTATPVQGITPVTQGGALKLDLAQFSSDTIAISIVSEKMPARTLLTLPLLSDSIGLTVPIPTDIAPDRYNLVVTGLEKGEKLTLPIEVQGVKATTDPDLAKKIVIAFTVTGLAVVLIALARKRIEKNT